MTTDARPGRPARRPPQALSPRTNWAGNYTYRATVLHRPATLEQVQDVVAVAPRVRVLGSRHSFTDIADSAELISLEELPADVVVDARAGTVSLGGGVTYAQLTGALRDAGVALHNLASLPHISVAGAVATATHGSGVGNGNLATAVAGLELVTSAGEVVRSARGEPDFDGLVVGLGALGAVTRLTLDVEPAYEVAQRVFEDLSWDTLYTSFDEITAAGYSVSLFTRWGPAVDMVWVKSRTDRTALPAGDLLGAAPAATDRHPVPGVDPAPATEQHGRPGSWADRLPHFRAGFTPSTGNEIQSEYLVPHRCAVDAIEALRSLGHRMRPLLQVAEIRTVAADRLWMSTAYGEPAVAFHFTWRPEAAPVGALVRDLERVLAPFGARPHWGKVFAAEAPAIAALYERHADFVRLVDRLDPRGAFGNPWLDRHVLGRR
jgi:alditol oxidase